MSEILISRFHPAVERAEDLESIFVGRERKDYVEDIIKELKEEIESDRYLQSHLFYGPAGIGKTFLLSIIFHRIKEDTSLSKHYFPILLPEELFGARNVAEILQRALEVIINIPGRTIQDEKIHEFVNSKIKWVEEGENKDKRFNRAKSVFEEIRDRFRKRTIIMVENLDRLIDSFEKNEVDNFLSLLPRSKSLKLLATSATFIEILGKRDSSIYGYFKKHEISRFSDSESFELISRIQEFYAKESPRLIKYLRSPQGERRIRIFQAISYLSGGLPRMIFPLFEIVLSECGRIDDEKSAEIRWRSSFGFMQEIFEKLTLIYREALWILPPKERKIIELFAESEQSLQPKEIEEKTSFSLAEVSTYILRLIKKGWLRSATESTGKERFYILSEPLFSIWYKWRKGGSWQEKWSFVIPLFAHIFSHDELIGLKKKVPGELVGLYEQAIRLKERFIIEKPFLEPLSYEIERDKERPDLAKEWVDKGVELGTLGRYEEALTAYEKAIELEPDDAWAWRGKGYALGELGRYEEALVATEKAIELKPDMAEAWNNKGWILGKLGRYEEELAAYEKAIELKPDDAFAWNNKGCILGNLGRYEEAFVAIEKAIKLKSDCAWMWYNKGWILGELGRYEEALVAFEKAIELKPDDVLAWRRKGYALGELGRYEEALVAIEKAIELKPDDALAWWRKGYALGELGRYEEALAAYEKAIELEPDEAIAWYNKGCILDKLGRYEEALAAFEKAIELKPDDAVAWYNKGEILDKLGRYEEGFAAYKEGIRLKPQKSFYSIEFQLESKNYGLVKKRLGEIRAMEIPSDDIDEAFILLLKDLFSKSRYEEAIILKDMLKELNWEKLWMRLNIFFVANEIGGYLERDEPLKALKRLERLEAVERKLIEKLFEAKYGKDWLKEAREKIKK
ncbi:MAG: tetratricopeptide repeat protein [bacterium]